MKFTQNTNVIKNSNSSFKDHGSSFIRIFRWIKRVLIIGTIAILVTVVALLINYFVFNMMTKERIYTSSELIPFNKVGLVLGTAKYYKTGVINQYYQARIEGAYELITQGKVHYLLLSGDNRFSNYNEPITMRNDLINKGITPDSIFLDFAGFRTLDSVVRAKSVFQTPSYTIITQRFHCERALFIARFNDIDAVCFAVPGPNSHFIKLRELFARASATIDIFILNKAPHFLGPNIEIPSEQFIKPADLNAVEQPHTRKTLN